MKYCDWLMRPHRAAWRQDPNGGGQTVLSESDRTALGIGALILYVVTHPQWLCTAVLTLLAFGSLLGVF